MNAEFRCVTAGLVLPGHLTHYTIVMTGTNRTHWVFTLNNPTEQPLEFIERVTETERVRYIVFQLEQGENGTPHWQGYIELTRSNHLSWLRNHISDTAHWEPRRGSRLQARDYARKDETRVDGPWESGEWREQGQGNRSDLTEFRLAIQSGKRKRELMDDGYDIQIAKFPRFYETVRTLTRPKREHAQFVGVVLLYGYPGTGKTRYVVENYPDYWETGISGTGTHWYDGYDLHNVVLFDDFCGKMSKMPLCTVLKLFDRYVRQAPVKGGFTWWRPNIIFVTSNIHPRDWYDWELREAQWPALIRRFSHVYFYEEDGGVEMVIPDPTGENLFWNCPGLFRS